MTRLLLALAFLCAAGAAGVAGEPSAVPGVKRVKKRAKAAPQAPPAKRKAVVPSPPAPPPAVACRWTSPDPVSGRCGGPGCASPPCSTANRGAQGMGGGAVWTCVCE